jgi:hypothetical protein
MNKEKWIALGVVLALISASASYLNSVRNRQRLGKPGLKMVDRPVVDEKGEVIGTNTVDLPLTVLDYVAKPWPVSRIECNTLPKDTTFGRVFYVPQNRQDRFEAGLSVVLMGADRTSIHKPEICLETSGWRIERSELSAIPISRPHPYELPVLKLTARGQRKLPDGGTEDLRAIYVYWFVSDSRLTAKHRERVWWMVKDLVSTGVLSRWAYVACLSICPPGQEDATFDRMKQLIAASVPEFQLVTGARAATALPVKAAAR